jgi:VanZ family protein
MDDSLAKEPKIYIRFIFFSIILWSVFASGLLGIVYMSFVIRSESSTFVQDGIDIIKPYISIPFTWDAILKIDHIIGFGLLTFVCYLSLSSMDHITNKRHVQLLHPNFASSRIVVHSFVTFCLIISIAAGIEYAQIFYVDRTSSLNDFLADAAGMFGALIVIRFVLLIYQIIRFIVVRTKKKS